MEARGDDAACTPGASRRRVSVPSPRRARCAAANSLFAREVEGAGALPRASALQRSLGSAALAAQLDVASGSAAAEHAQLSFLRRRSRIVELVACSDGQGGGVVVGLAHNGRCVAFCRDTHACLGSVNASPAEVVRSVFYNKHNGDLLTVSVFASDSWSTLRCRSTPVRLLRHAGTPRLGAALFETEALRWPGFVELDDVNGAALTYSESSGAFRVFSLQDYALLYTVADTDVQEAKISPGVLMLIHALQRTHVKLRILCIKTGALMATLVLPLVVGRKVEFIEQFNDSVLMKQEGAPLRMVNVCTGQERAVADFATPNAFIFLHERASFLAVHGRTLANYDRRGEKTTHFADHALWHADGCATNTTFVTADQSAVVSYCQPAEGADATGAGAVHVSDVLTGARLARVSPGGDAARRAALTDVTAVFYDEERGALFTGNRSGCVSVWAT